MTGAHLRIDFPLTAASIEEQARESDEDVVDSIDVGGLSSTTVPISFGGEARLLGLLARLNQDSNRPNLVLPPGGRVDALPAGATSELGYFVLSRMSNRVLHRGVDRTGELFKAQTRQLTENDGMLRTESLRAYFYDHQLPGLPIASALTQLEAGSPRVRALRRMLVRDLHELGLSGPLTPGREPDPDNVRHVRTFVSEAIENARVHATKDLEGQHIRGIAFLAIKRFFFREQRRSIAGTGGALERYFVALESDLGYDLDKVAFAEFTVADSGVGIPAHYGNRLKLTPRSFVEESEILQRAFRMSEEAVGGTWNGIGLSKILESTRALQALLTVRSGQVEATRHFIQDADADLLRIDLRPEPLARLGGTAISLVVPWIDSSPQLPFDQA